MGGKVPILPSLQSSSSPTKTYYVKLLSYATCQSYTYEPSSDPHRKLISRLVCVDSLKWKRSENQRFARKEGAQGSMLPEQTPPVWIRDRTHVFNIRERALPRQALAVVQTSLHLARLRQRSTLRGRPHFERGLCSRSCVSRMECHFYRMRYGRGAIAATHRSPSSEYLLNLRRGVSFSALYSSAPRAPRGWALLERVTPRRLAAAPAAA